MFAHYLRTLRHFGLSDGQIISFSKFDELGRSVTTGFPGEKGYTYEIVDKRAGSIACAEELARCALPYIFNQCGKYKIIKMAEAALFASGLDYAPIPLEVLETEPSENKEYTIWDIPNSEWVLYLIKNQELLMWLGSSTFPVIFNKTAYIYDLLHIFQDELKTWIIENYGVVLGEKIVSFREGVLYHRPRLATIKT